jgi:hypothetical protein
MKTTLLAVLAGASLAGCGSDDAKCDPDAPNTICTIAGKSLDQGYKGDGGKAVDATLYIPMDSHVAANGDVWFIDFNNYVIRTIDANGIIQTVIGSGELGDSPATEQLATIPALQSKNNHTPTFMFSGDYVYLASWHESRVKRVKLGDMNMELFAGRGVRTHYDGDGGPAAMAGVDLPASIALDPAGNFVFTDQGNLVVRKIDAAGIISTIVGQCIVEETPCGSGVQPQACPGSNKLACGDIATECDKLCTQSYGGDGGLAINARLNLPFTQAADPTGRIAYDHQGNLIIADTGNHRIRKVDTAGMITTIVGTGKAGYAGDGGQATAAQINHPVDIAIGDDDTIYFTDVFNHCVRKVDTSGVISTVAGQCHFTPAGGDGKFSGDGGDPLEAQLNRPYGIDLVGTKLYISDSYNNRLRVVNLQ